nr:two-component system sensor kinase [Rhodococcus sp. JVH1]
MLLEQIAPNEAFGVVYLLGVLVVSMVWGLGLAMVTSVASAIAFDYFRNWPEGFLAAGAQNWVAIAVFLAVALSANTLAGMARSRADQLRALGDQQAALRRVATLVARGATSSEVFTAVTEELARVLGVFNTALFRFEPDGESTLLASRTEPGVQKTPVGTRHPLEGETLWRWCSAPAVPPGWTATTMLPVWPPRTYASWASGQGSERRSSSTATCGARPRPDPRDASPCHPTPSRASPTSRT